MSCIMYSGIINETKCKIDGEIHIYHLMNSKKKTIQNSNFKYLGFGHIYSCEGEKQGTSLTGHFWKRR